MAHGEPWPPYSTFFVLNCTGYLNESGLVNRTVVIPIGICITFFYKRVIVLTYDKMGSVVLSNFSLVSTFVELLSCLKIFLMFVMCEKWSQYSILLCTTKKSWECADAISFSISMSFIVSIHADFKPVLSPYIKVLPI
jgi:hypothetical protein